MAWEVEFTEEFEGWWGNLTEDEQVSVSALILVLQEKGPSLKRPYSGIIVSSKFMNMKELIVQHQGEPYRVLYIFDPRRHAILLLGGNKTGNDRWYEENVPKADKVYEVYLEEIKKEGLLK
jgi:hypothetical protein